MTPRTNNNKPTHKYWLRSCSNKESEEESKSGEEESKSGEEEEGGAEKKKEGERGKCTDCGKYYSCEMFNNYCSHCYKQYDHSGWWQKVGKYTTQYHDNTYLKEYTDSRKIPHYSKEWTLLKRLWEFQMIGNHDTFTGIVNHMFASTDYIGISYKQAVTIWSLFCNSATNNTDKKIYWKYSHLLCGFIIDWWNINLIENNVGPAMCYYTDKKPVVNRRIRNTPLYNYYILCKHHALYHKDKTMILKDRERIQFWKNNIPFNLGNMCN